MLHLDPCTARVGGHSQRKAAAHSTPGRSLRDSDSGQVKWKIEPDNQPAPVVAEPVKDAFEEFHAIQKLQSFTPGPIFEDVQLLGRQGVRIVEDAVPTQLLSLAPDRRRTGDAGPHPRLSQYRKSGSTGKAFRVASQSQDRWRWPRMPAARSRVAPQAAESLQFSKHLRSCRGATLIAEARRNLLDQVECKFFELDDNEIE